MRKPAIRFKGFKNDWEQRKFSDVVEIGSGMDYKHLGEGDIPVYGTGGYMLSVDAALSEDKDAIGIGRKGTIDKPYILRAPFWTVDTLFYCIPKDGYDLDFTSCLFQNVDWKKKDESTGVPSLSKVIINNVETAVPSYEEQRKIGDYFKGLDNLITLHQRKYESLQSLKKSMLVKMFPLEGEKKPEIRFEGFTDDWEQRKLSEVSKIVGGGTPSTSNPEYWDGDIDWYAPAEIGNQIFACGSVRKITKAGLEHSSASILPADKTVLFTSRAGIGNMAILRHPGATNQGFQSIICNDDIDPYFIYSMGTIIKEKAEKVAAGSTFSEISGKKLGELEFMFPAFSEQKHIGEYFESLDNLITLHQRKYESLQNLKSALMQNMFV